MILEGINHNTTLYTASSLTSQEITRAIIYGQSPPPCITLSDSTIYKFIHPSSAKGRVGGMSGHDAKGYGGGVLGDTVIYTTSAWTLCSRE